MKRISTVFLFICITLPTYAQIDPVGNFNRHVFEKWRGEYIRIGTYKVKGSPYLLGEAFPGVITYTDGKTVRDEKILYDLYSQKAGIDIKNEIFERNVPIETFSINLPEYMGGQSLLFKNPIVDGKAEVKGYLNVLEEGKRVSIFKLFKIRLVVDPTNHMDKDVRVFEQYNEYLLYLPANKSLKNIKLRKRDFIKEFGNEEFVKNYFLSKEIDFSKENEVIEFVKEFNNIR